MSGLEQPGSGTPTKPTMPAIAARDVVRETTAGLSLTTDTSLPPTAPASFNGQPTSPRSSGGGRFMRDSLGLSPDYGRSQSQSPFRLSIPSVSPGQLAFSAMQYLPVPVIVLNSLKTVVMANEAMGRMIGILPENPGGDDDDDPLLATDKLRGQTLAQVGVDMLQDGRPVWVTWETFLDTLVDELGTRPPATQRRSSISNPGDNTPTLGTAPTAGHTRKPSANSRPTQDAVVEVIISRKGYQKTTFDNRYKSKESEFQAFAKMIITVWEVEDRQTYFTLTFTNTQSTQSTPISNKKAIAKPSVLEAAEKRTIPNSTPSSSRDSNSPLFTTPNVVTMSSSPFPPMGPPSIASHTQSSSPSLLQKIIRMKDALLDNTQMPIVAMWKDGSVTFPNKAARQLLPHDADLDSSSEGFDMLKNWKMWDDEFTRQLDEEEYPMHILLKTGQPFSSIRVGMHDASGNRVVYDVLGEIICDDKSNEFLAGVVTFQDVTDMTAEITQIRERDEERFKIICDTMPQLVWTATPEGMHDFFNTRWYNYTGLTPEDCLGHKWHSSFHPDDMPEALARWTKSLETGEPYVMEYRCQNKEGEWRWFLGRALAVRNKDTGEIEKWFGTCTDVHESIETKLAAKRTRQQLLSVIAHSHVTIFTVDPNRRVTMLEGALIWNSFNEEPHDRWYIGEDMYTVFNRLTEDMPEGERPDWLQPIEDVLAGKRIDDVKEHALGKRTPSRFHSFFYICIAVVLTWCR